PTMPVIGFLNSASPESFAPQLAGFHQGLNEVGYVEGRNVTIEFRWAKAQYNVDCPSSPLTWSAVKWQLSPRLVGASRQLRLNRRPRRFPSFLPAAAIRCGRAWLPASVGRAAMLLG